MPPVYAAGSHPGADLEQRDPLHPHVVRRGERDRRPGRRVALFLLLREQLGRDAGEQLGRYPGSLEHWIAGDLEYPCRAPRYASPRNRNELPADGARFDVTWRDTPSDARVEPPPVPALARWWQQLDA